MPTTVLMVSTRKGAWLFRSDASRKTWTVDGPHFLGHIISQLVLDPRDKTTLLAAAKTGHLGPTIFRSTDWGRSWREAAQPPAFARAPAGETGRAVDHTFWLTPAHRSEPGVWYAGTSPQGLFRSQDGGITWAPFSSINDDPQFRLWMGSEKDGTPDGPKLHSIIVDPRDPSHLYFGMSGGGVHESVDGGLTWRLLISAWRSSRASDSIRRTPLSTTRIACASARAIPTASTSRITAASIASTGLRIPGSASVETCPRTLATSASR